MIELIIPFILVISFITCLADWRKGLFLSVFIGFLQDPLRKLMPDEPLYMSAMIVFVAFLALLGARIRLREMNFRAVPFMKDYISSPLYLFIVLIVLQTGIAFLNTNSFAVAGIGFIVYLSPVLVLLLAVYFVRNQNDVVRIMQYYVFFCALMTIGIYLSYLEFDWDILSAVGSDLYVYPLSGGAIKLHAGFFRSSEIAAWHIGTSICLIFTLFIMKEKRLLIKWFSIPLVMFFLLALILAGRRKIIVEIILFLSFYGYILLHFRRGALKLAIFTLSLGLLLSYFGNSYVIKDSDSDLHKYFERPKGIVEASVERLNIMTIGSFRWVIARNGFLGSGAGTGSQGAQHFGGGAVQVGYAAEGGLAKVLAELGIPGLAIFLWLLFSIARCLKRILDETKKSDLSGIPLIYGLLALLSANAVIFVTAHQVFGDIFVLFMLGLMLGFVFGMKKIQKMPDLLDRS
jgi:hypothetical protein